MLLIKTLNRIVPIDAIGKNVIDTVNALFTLDKHTFIQFYCYNERTAFLCQLLGGFSMEKSLRIDRIMSIHQNAKGEFRLGPPRAIGSSRNKNNGRGQGRAPNRDIINRDEYAKMLEAIRYNK